MNTCSNCKHYHPFNGENKGECWLNPPEIYAFGQSSRPRIMSPAKETCGQHAAGEPVVREKVNVTDTSPAAAAKQARKDKPKYVPPAMAKAQYFTTDAVAVPGCKVTIPEKMP